MAATPHPDLPRALKIDHVADGVYISGWRATMYADYLRHAAITNVLKLYEDIPYFPPDFNTLDHAINDGELVPEDALTRGAAFVVERIDAGERVLVMCGAGISRSSAFVIAYLLERGRDLRDAYFLLREKHPGAMPHPRMWESLITHYELDYTVDQAMDWVLLGR